MIMQCPKCKSNIYSHHQQINYASNEIKRDYCCRKCKYVFQTIERIIDTADSNVSIVYNKRSNVE